VVTALRRQSSRGRIWHITQLVRNCQDLGDEIRIDSPLASQSTRHSAWTDSRSQSDIVQGYATCRSMVFRATSGCFQGFVRSKNDCNLIRIALSQEFNLKNLVSLGIDFPNKNLTSHHFLFF